MACFLGGATQKWAEGIIVLALGIYLMFRPPQLSLGWTVNVLLVALVGCAALAFLPAHLFFIPGWRSPVTDDLAIAIPSTVSPQPWLTAGALVSLIAGICW